MKKLLAFVTILSFSTTEASFLGDLGNIANTAVQSAVTYNNLKNGYVNNGVVQQNAGINRVGYNNGVMYNTGTNGTVYNNGAVYNPGTNGAVYNNGVQYNTGMNGAAYNNGVTYNTGVTTGMTNTVNTTAISNALTNMYNQAAQIQNSYRTNTNIVTYTSNLGNVLMSCRQYPNQVSNQLPTILQYVLGIYNILNQLGAGAQISNLADGFNELFLACLGLNS